MFLDGSDDMKLIHVCKTHREKLFPRPSGHERCGIMNCGDSYPQAEMRTYRLGKTGIACCPECWAAMELPDDCRDTADLSPPNVD